MADEDVRMDEDTRYWYLKGMEDTMSAVSGMLEAFGHEGHQLEPLLGMMKHMQAQMMREYDLMAKIYLLENKDED